MKGIPGQKRLCESLEIQVGGYISLLEPQNKEAVLHTNASIHYGAIYGPKKPHQYVDLALAPLVDSPAPSLFQ